MGRLARQPFRRRDDHVAVRRIRLGPDQYIEPGEPVPAGVRLHVRRHWYDRRRTGVAGAAWTAQALARQGYPQGFSRTDAAAPVTPDDRPRPPGDTPDAILEQPADDAAPEPVREGSRWIIPGVPEHTFRTKTAALAYLEHPDTIEE